MEKLKPCPFCGSEAESYETTTGSLVECSNFDCHVGTLNNDWTKKKVISIWNTRTSGWISVDDALPETEQICDVWLSCSDGSKGRLSNVIWNGKDWIDAFFNRTKIHEEQWITHWIAAPSEPDVKHG